MRLPHLVPVVGLTAVLVSGCTASANLTTSASSVAEKAAAALQEEIGAGEPPGLDCGDGQVDLVQGTVVDCVLTDPATGTQYDAQVTITRAEGTSYSISVESSSTPRGGSSAAPTGGATSAPSSAASSAPSAAVPTQVRQDDLAALATDALEPQLGFRPTILCARATYLPLAVGEAATCQLSGGDLEFTEVVTITITEVDGASYEINAVVG